LAASATPTPSSSTPASSAPTVGPSGPAGGIMTTQQLTDAIAQAQASSTVRVVLAETRIGRSPEAVGALATPGPGSVGPLGVLLPDPTSTGDWPGPIVDAGPEVRAGLPPGDSDLAGLM